MTTDLANLFFIAMFISLATFGGGSQALFYQYGVAQQQWLSSADLSTILAFGYATPGPAVFGTATFIGYHLAGVAGALIGTIGVFLVPFTLSIVAARYFKHILETPMAKSAIRAIGLTAAGLVAATAINLSYPANAYWWQLLILLASLVISLRWKVNPAYILVAGGLLGLALS